MLMLFQTKKVLKESILKFSLERSVTLQYDISIWLSKGVYSFLRTIWWQDEPKMLRKYAKNNLQGFFSEIKNVNDDVAITLTML